MAKNPWKCPKCGRFELAERWVNGSGITKIEVNSDGEYTRGDDEIDYAKTIGFVCLSCGAIVEDFYNIEDMNVKYSEREE